MILRQLLIIAVVLCSAGVAGAADDDGPMTARARVHFDSGRRLYDLGDYAEALRQFQRGYDFLPRAEFLLNMAQCRRQLEQLDEARALFKRYLAQAPADAPERGQVPELIAEIDRVLADRRAAAAASVVKVEKAAAPTVKASPRPRRSAWRRLWWIVPVSAVAAAGLGAGLYFAVRPTGPPCGSVVYGCIEVTR
jgi:tetratricopeptide (TPR) repeat protein